MAKRKVEKVEKRDKKGHIKKNKKLYKGKVNLYYSYR